jgi:UDP-N-acetylmuramoyl-tripeptide--D-alanyl-D-alanine ligase
MVSLSATELARLAGGAVLSGDPARSVSHFEIDSRRVTPGGLFVAIQGEKHDGHEFWPDAAEHGATAILCHRDFPPVRGTAPTVIRVGDTTAALRRLAAEVRAARPWTVIGVTGSVGKTTTKELIFMALGGRARAARSPGNFNNLFGLPLAILNAPEVPVLVLELGISTPGEMDELAALARPDIAVITAIAAVHTEFLGDESGVLAEKRKILGHGATTLVYSQADKRLSQLAAELNITTIGCGSHPIGTAGENDVRGEKFTQHEAHLVLEAHYRGKLESFTLSGAGQALAQDLLLALGVASALQIGAADVQAGISYYQPGPGRGQLLNVRGVRLLDESYNASPAAVAESLRTLQDWGEALVAPRRIAVLGDMLELGPAGPRAHALTGAQAKSSGVELLVGVGPLMTEAVARFAALGGEARHYPDSTAAGAAARSENWLNAGDAVLVKGSRGMRMENFITALRDEGIFAAGGNGASHV